MPATKSASNEEPIGNIIAIGGLVGSGKNTVGKNVAEELAWRQVEPTFKTLAEREGISLMEFQNKAGKDFNIDKKFDEALKAECAGGDCVVTTWLGPWMAPGRPFRVWLDVDEDVRAYRVSQRDKVSLTVALEHVRTRDADNRLRYMKVYAIDLWNHDSFDLVLSVQDETPDNLARTIIDAYQKARHEG
jgi:cytidylate kinase